MDHRYGAMPLRRYAATALCRYAAVRAKRAVTLPSFVHRSSAAPHSSPTPVSPIQHPVSDRLDDMARFDFLALGEVGDGSGDA